MYVYELTLSVYYIKYFWSTITGSWILHTTDSKVMHKINVLNVEMLYTWLGCMQGYALSGGLANMVTFNHDHFYKKCTGQFCIHS